MSGCQKKDKTKLSKASFTIIGKEWKSDLGYHITNMEHKFAISYGRGIYGKYKDPSFGVDEYLFFGYVVKKLGKQYLPSIRSRDIRNLTVENIPAYGYFSTNTNEGCVSCEDFMVDSNYLDQNWIEVTKEEGNYQKIWGKFNLVLITEDGERGCNDYPDKVRIENGTFYLEL